MWLTKQEVKQVSGSANAAIHATPVEGATREQVLDELQAVFKRIERGEFELVEGIDDNVRKPNADKFINKE